jgi:WD40 repeat protein
MLLVRVLAAAMKPAMVTGAIAATTAGGLFAYSNYTSDSPTAFQRVQQAGGRLLVSEFGATADVIIAIDPNDVSGSREVIATIDHAAEYGITAALSPDGGAIAYTALPADTADPAPDVPAIAGIVNANGDVVVLANDIDLVVPPVWSPDGGAIVVRKNTACETAGLSCDDYPAGFFELILLGRDGSRSTITSWRSAGAFPVGFSPDGSTFYFATLNAAGTDLYRVAPDGSGEALVAHLSDQIARDWQISPDGASLAYSAAESGAEPMVVARVVDLATGAVVDALGEGSLEAGPSSTGVARGEFNPAWQPDGDLTVASMNLDGGSAAVSVGSGGTEVETQSSDSMDLPLNWSPDGGTLAVRSVDGETPFEAGASHVELISDGGRERISESSDVTIVGWMP